LLQSNRPIPSDRLQQTAPGGGSVEVGEAQYGAGMGRVTVLDGGTGRELARIGAPFSQPLWTALAMIEEPDVVRRVLESYIAAVAHEIATKTNA
jgi:S-methylmethionine-dependent homocysteine/selenocysteine methylase